MAHIMATALLGEVASTKLAPPDPNAVEQYGHLVIQALVAIVTIWATVRKALQKPEAVVKVPAASVPVIVAKPVPPVTSGTEAGEVRDGGIE